jgi:hypothetical protein
VFSTRLQNGAAKGFRRWGVVIQAAEAAGGAEFGKRVFSSVSLKLRSKPRAGGTNRWDSVSLADGRLNASVNTPRLFE